MLALGAPAGYQLNGSRAVIAFESKLNHVHL
jgi:hypothetical protein